MTAEKRKRNPFIAAFLSLLAPGLGQIYDGKGALGLAVLIIWTALPFLWAASGWLRYFYGLVALVLAAIALWLFTIMHAFILALRNKETELKKYQAPLVYAFFIVLSLGMAIFVPAGKWMSLLGVSPLKIPTESMMPTLHKGDLLMADLKAYHGRAPKRGDLVVVDYPLDPTRQFIKRVIAVEGDLIEIKAKQVFIDGEPLQESYKLLTDPGIDEARDNFGRLKIPAGQCFVLGDSRDNSNDSRFWGALALANVKGQVLYVYWAKDKKRIGLTPH